MSRFSFTGAWEIFSSPSNLNMYIDSKSDEAYAAYFDFKEVV
jgi:hypothetical protein